MLQLDLQQILSQAISFVLLVVFLKAFAWERILGALDARRHRIEEELRQIAQGKSELERLKADYDRRLAAIEEEARQKIQQAVLEGKRIAMDIQEQARAQGQALTAKAKETIELELAKAKVALRNDVTAMTVAAVEKILRRKLDAQTDAQLVDTIVGELERAS
jgi:F-type H+-transporting ATPase subunit b